MANLSSAVRDVNYLAHINKGHSALAFLIRFMHDMIAVYCSFDRGGKVAQNPVLKALIQGREEGARATQIMILGFLQEKYLDNEVERGTPKGDAILQLAREISEVCKTGHVDLTILEG